SDTWDRNLDNVFETQDEISLLIADKLREQYGHFEIQEHLVDKQTSVITAYDLVLKARFFRNKWNPVDIKEAIALLEEAVALDPEYAEAYADLADCYSFLGTTGFMPYSEAWQQSHNYTLQAQKLDKNLPEVFYQLSNEAFFIEANHQGSLALMKKALVVDPNNAKAHEFLSFLYIIAGDRKKSLEHLDNALQINPMSEETKFFNGYFHYMIGDFEKANLILDKCIEVNDKNIPAHSIKSFILLIQKKYDEAISYFETIQQEVVIPEEKSGVKLLAHAIKKDKARTAVYLNEVKEQTNGHNKITADSFVLFYHVLMGEVDQAFDWINSAIKSGSFVVPLRFYDPIIRSLRSDPRYNEYEKKIFKGEKAESPTPKKKPLLDAKMADQLVKELESHIQNVQPYLDPDLTLRTLSEQIKVQANQLSWLINSRLGKNFNDYINHFRNETFKSLVKKPENADITIMGLAYDSGYNSKTTFNTSFKKETGLTPKQFMKGLE
ncbi:MAG: tetratricopeptide repeat protein, partial [Flavobacteriales bacterium]